MPELSRFYRVRSAEVIGPYTLRVWFDDQTEQVINFDPVLAGPLYGPLRDPEIFNQARSDPEVETVVWPNGADFDPAALHDWPEHVEALTNRARKWKLAPT